jgi:hypothetical protein
MVAVISLQAIAQDRSVDRGQCRVNNQSIMKKLPKGETLFELLATGNVGDGNFFAWMEKMREFNIKTASAKIDFEYRNQILKLSVRSISLSTRYYNFGEGSEPHISVDEKTSLHESLVFPFLKRAIRSLEILRVKKNNCGSLYLRLLDDGCLPIADEIPEIEVCETVEAR